MTGRRILYAIWLGAALLLHLFTMNLGTWVVLVFSLVNASKTSFWARGRRSIPGWRCPAETRGGKTPSPPPAPGSRSAAGTLSLRLKTQRTGTMVPVLCVLSMDRADAPEKPSRSCFPVPRAHKRPAGGETQFHILRTWLAPPGRHYNENSYGKPIRNRSGERFRYRLCDEEERVCTNTH